MSASASQNEFSVMGGIHGKSVPAEASAPQARMARLLAELRTGFGMVIGAALPSRPWLEDPALDPHQFSNRISYAPRALRTPNERWP